MRIAEIESTKPACTVRSCETSFNGKQTSEGESKYNKYVTRIPKLKKNVGSRLGNNLV